MTFLNFIKWFIYVLLYQKNISVAKKKLNKWIKKKMYNFIFSLTYWRFASVSSYSGMMQKFSLGRKTFKENIILYDSHFINYNSIFKKNYIFSCIRANFRPRVTENTIVQVTGNDFSHIFPTYFLEYCEDTIDAG